MWDVWGGGEICIQSFGGETWGKEHLEDLDVDNVNNPIKMYLKLV
jgi:hypothetical protein